METIHGIVVAVGQKRAMVIEEHIKLHLQPKPWWLPHLVWTSIIKRLLVLELFERALTEEGEDE